MRALIFSDIHDNIDHVRLLRGREKNNYDFIIVAGDIGDKITSEFLEVVDTFACPTYFVYGNWDGRSEYEIDLPNNCFLLNQSIKQCGDYYIAGFSGCPSHWGKNPIYRELQNRVLEKHSEILTEYNSAQQVRSEAMRQLKAETDISLQSLFTVYPDKGRKYETDVLKIKKKENKALESLDKPVAKVMRAAAFTKYWKDREKARLAVANENRRVLFNKIKDSRIPQNKLILVTHERLFRLADEGIDPLLHVFGHVHEYKLTNFKGTWYLNAAALDSGASEIFGRAETLPVGYCIVEFSGNSLSVERKLLLET